MGLESRMSAQEYNQSIWERLDSRDPQQFKLAEDSLNEYTRTTIREQGYARQLLPMKPITNSELHKQLNTDKNVRVEEKEGDSPAAVSVQYNGQPNQLYIKNNKYLVTFNRIITRRFAKDVTELRTWSMDLRTIISDNSARAIQATEDASFTNAHNAALIAPNTVVPTSGVIQWAVLQAGITRDSTIDTLKVMPNTPFNIEVDTCLVNQITIKDFMKWGYNESGGEISGDIMKNGWTLKEFMGVKWLVTIKKGLVPTNRVYQYTIPQMMGKAYELEPPTLYVNRRAFMIEFFMYEEIGMTFGHTGGLGIIDWQT